VNGFWLAISGVQNWWRKAKPTVGKMEKYAIPTQEAWNETSEAKPRANHT